MKNQPIPTTLICNILEILSVMDISEMNGNYQRLVVQNILATNKHVEDLKVSELILIIQDSYDEFEESQEQVRKIMSEYNEQ